MPGAGVGVVSSGGSSFNFCQTRRALESKGSHVDELEQCLKQTNILCIWRVNWLVLCQACEVIIFVVESMGQEVRVNK